MHCVVRSEQSVYNNQNETLWNDSSFKLITKVYKSLLSSLHHHLEVYKNLQNYSLALLFFN